MPLLAARLIGRKICKNYLPFVFKKRPVASKKRPKSLVYFAGGPVKGHGKVIGPVIPIVRMTIYTPCQTGTNRALAPFSRVPFPPHGDVPGIVPAIVIQFIQLTIVLIVFKSAPTH